MRLIIPEVVERKLNAYVQSVDTEIAGMGKARIDPETKDVIMEDVAIYEQEVTGGTADLSSLSVARWATDLLRQGGNPGEWFIWWHSHADMSAFFSATDTGTIAASTEYEYLISLVVNRKRERRARLDTHSPFRLTVDNLTIEIERSEPDPLVLTIEQQIRELLSRKTEIEEASFPGLTEEVAEKVKVKSFGGTGYGKHGQVTYQDHEYCTSAYCYEAIADFKNSCLKDPSLKKALATDTGKDDEREGNGGEDTVNDRILTLPPAGGNIEVDEIQAAIQNIEWELKNCKQNHLNGEDFCDRCIAWAEEQNDYFNRLVELFDDNDSEDSFEQQVREGINRALRGDKK